MVPEARKLHAVSYEEMLEMAASGARVLQLRAVEYARGSGVMLHVRSAFSDEDGTWVREEDRRMEQAMISGVVHDTSEAKITVEDVPDRPGIAAAIFRAVADEGIGVDTIVQNVSRDGRTDVSFTVPKDDLAHARQVMDRVSPEVGAARYSADDGIAKVSLVGAGMKSHPGVQADMFSALAEAGINIEMISTSSIRITCVIRDSDVEGAVRALHARFSLSDEAVVREH
jgi:aspartate kinase